MAVINNPQIKWWDGNGWRPTPDAVGARFTTATAAGTICAITSIPASVNGTATFTAAGTVKTSAGANATNGSVQMQYLNGASWTNSGSAFTVTAGTFSVTGLSETATRQWRAVYTPASTFQAATSLSKTVTSKVLTTFVKTYACTASGSYRGSGTKRTDVGTDLYQGYYSSVNGIQRSIMIFPRATIATDLASAVSVTKAELYLNCLRWGPDAGGTAIVNDHNYSTLPSADPQISTTNQTFIPWTTKTGAKWCNISTVIVNRIVANTAQGCSLYAASQSNEYYGYFAGKGDTGAPQLRVTFTKWV